MKTHQNSEQKAKRAAQKEEGFTLTEVLVVVVIIAILAAVAVPLLVRDSAERDFEKGVAIVTQKIQRAKYKAISSKNVWAIVFTGTTTVQLSELIPGDTAATHRETSEMPPEVEVTGFKLGAQVAGGVTPTACGSMEIRYSPVSDLQLAHSCGGSLACADTCSLTIYIRTKSNQHKARIVLYKATGYAKRIGGW